jgi:hypothetical protein
MASDSFVSPLLTPLNLEIEWAVTEWNLSSTVRFGWLAPPATTFLDYDRFREGWNSVIKDSWVVNVDHATAVERLAFVWFSLGTSVVLKETPITLALGKRGLPWKELISRLDNAQVKGSTGDRFREWVSRVLEMLMPEMGLPATIVQQFKNARETHKRWRRARLAVKQRRARRLRQLYEVDPKLALRLADGSVLAKQFAPERREYSVTD